MRSLFRVGAGGIVCLALAAGAVILLADPTNIAAIDRAIRWNSGHGHSSSSGARLAQMPASAQSFPMFSTHGFEGGGYSAANMYTGTIADRGSLDQVRAAIRGRAARN